MGVYTVASTSAKASPAAEKPAGLTKMEIVRRTISHLGRGAKLRQIQSHIKTKYGIEMTIKHISACTSEIQREVGGGAKPATSTAATKPTAVPKPMAVPKPVAKVTAAPKPTSKPTAASKPAAKKPITQRSAAKISATPKAAPTSTAVGHAAGNGKAADGINLADIAAVKGLVGRVGLVQLRALIDLLAQ
jgi:hypothetical protein